MENHPFFKDNFTFVNYGNEHWVTLLIWLIIGIVFIIGSKRLLNPKQQRITLFLFGLFVLGGQVMKIICRLYLGVFDYTVDLPLHLCNMMPFVIPFALLINKRLIWAILFFWIMAGTFQALLSPTLEHSFPHYEYHRYWIVHAGLVIIALYPIFINGYRLYLSDALLSAICMNILGLFMYVVDVFLDANYMYMRAWPPGKTLYNFLGPWPYYNLSIELVIITLFGVFLIPFYFMRRREKSFIDRS